MSGQVRLSYFSECDITPIIHITHHVVSFLITIPPKLPMKLPIYAALANLQVTQKHINHNWPKLFCMILCKSFCSDDEQ